MFYVHFYTRYYLMEWAMESAYISRSDNCKNVLTNFHQTCGWWLSTAHSLLSPMTFNTWLWVDFYRGEMPGAHQSVAPRYSWFLCSVLRESYISKIRNRFFCSKIFTHFITPAAAHYSAETIFCIALQNECTLIVYLFTQCTFSWLRSNCIWV